MREYEIMINGLRHTIQYNEAEAERLGLKPVKNKAVPKPKNKARTSRSEDSKAPR